MKRINDEKQSFSDIVSRACERSTVSGIAGRFRVCSLSVSHWRDGLSAPHQGLREKIERDISARAEL